MTSASCTYVGRHFFKGFPVSTFQSRSDMYTAKITYKYNPNVFGFVKIPAYLPPSKNGRNKKEMAAISRNVIFTESLNDFHKRSFLLWFCHTKNTPVKTRASTMPRPHAFLLTSRSETVNAIHMPNQATLTDLRHGFRTNVRSRDRSAIISIKKIPHAVL